MKIFFVILAFIFFCTPTANSEGYSILVIPSGFVGKSSGNMLADKNIEDILAQNLIKYLDENDIAYAPKLNVMRLSIRNNSKLLPETSEPAENIKIISKSYGVSKVLLVSSNVEQYKISSQKYFWNKLGLPVIIPQETGSRIVTTVTYIDTSANNILWQDIFYKNINDISEKTNPHNINVSRINSATVYYDELAQDIVKNFKGTKETHAIMITDKNPAPEKKITVHEKHLNFFSFKRAGKDIKDIKDENVHKRIIVQKKFVTGLKDILQAKCGSFIQSFNSSKNKILNTKLQTAQRRHILKTKKADKEPDTEKAKRKCLFAKNIRAGIRKDKTNVTENKPHNSEYNGFSPSNSYLINRRNNARNYTLKFETPINDM